MSDLDPNIKNELEAPLYSQHVSQREQSGFKLDYIEGWWAVSEANRIFGFDGWTRETVEMECIRDAEKVGDKWRVGYRAKVRIHALGVFRDGTGYGSGIAKDQGDAVESAIKEAETDAMKRALMTFGNPFGLALYDKSRANVSAPAFEDAPTEPKTQQKPKAKSRKDFSYFVDAIRMTGDKDELKTVWEGFDWDALPADWQEPLVEEKDAKLLEFRENERARKNGKPPEQSIEEAYGQTQDT